MPWDYDDDEINGLIDSNIKSSPPAEPMVNKASTVRTALKQMWLAIRLQVASAVDGIDLISQTISEYKDEIAVIAGSIESDITNATAIVQGAETALPDTLPTFSVDFTNINILPPAVSFSRASTATYYDKMGMLRVAKANEPRFNFDPITRKCKGLLREKAGRNLNLYSEDFSNSAWTKTGCTSSLDGTTTPGGVVSLSKFVLSTGINTGSITKTMGVAVTGGKLYTAACFVKKKEINAIKLSLTGYGDWNGAAGGQCTFDLTAKTATPSASGHEAYGIIEISEGLFLCYITSLRIGDGNASAAISIYRNASGIDTDSVYIGGFSLEEGNLSSYIYSGATQGTRTADVLSITGTEFQKIFNPQELSIVIQFSYSGSYESVMYPLYLASVAPGQSLNIGNRSSAVSAKLLYTSYDSITQVNIAANPYVKNTDYTIAAGLKKDDVAVSLNGAAVLTDSSANHPSGLEQLAIGATTSGADGMSGHIKMLRIYPKRLSNVELIALGKSTQLSGNKPNQLPAAGMLGSAAFANLKDVLKMSGYNEFSMEGIGSNKTVTIRRPFDFSFAVVESTSITIVAQPPAECTANTDYTLTFNGATGKLITYSIIIKR